MRRLLEILDTYLDFFQKVMLVCSILLILIYALWYRSANTKDGYLSHDSLLLYSQEDGYDVYAADSRWTRSFTVSRSDHTVLYQIGEKSYGPYTVLVDGASSAGEYDSRPVEITLNGQSVFRGYYQKTGNGIFLCSEKETVYYQDDLFVQSYQTDTTDYSDSSFADIVAVAIGPELVHFGNRDYYERGILFCVLNLLSVFGGGLARRGVLSGRIKEFNGKAYLKLCAYQVVFLIIAIARFQEGLCVVA